MFYANKTIDCGCKLQIMGAVNHTVRKGQKMSLFTRLLTKPLYGIDLVPMCCIILFIFAAILMLILIEMDLSALDEMGVGREGQFSCSRGPSVLD